MANNVFDRTVINPLEKPLSVDINQTQAQLDRTLRNVLYHLLSRQASLSSYGLGVSSGFVGEGFFVVPNSPSDMSVIVKAGVGLFDSSADTPAAISGIPGLDDLSPYKPVVLSSPHTFSVPSAPSAPDYRRDIIEVRTNRVLGNPTSRQVLNVSTGAYSPGTVNKTLSFTVDGDVGVVSAPSDSTAALSYKVGVVDASSSPPVPATTTGYAKIAEIYVPNGTTSIPTENTVDRRALVGVGGGASVEIRFRLQWNGGSPIVTVESIFAPPSVRAVIEGSGVQRAAATVTIGGGQILTTCSQAEATPASVVSGSTVLSTHLNQILTVPFGTSGFGLDQKTATIGVVGYYLDASNFNVTNAVLEDVRWNVRAVLGY